MHIPKNSICKKSILTLIVLCFMFYGCAKKPLSENPVIRVNDCSIGMKEFKVLLTEQIGEEDTPAMRKAFLDNFLNRKVLLLEAQRQGLDQEEDFLKSIESFWEQSLLKAVIDRKIKEISVNVDVSEDEIKAHYYDIWVKNNPQETRTFQELHDIMQLQLLRDKQSAALDAWIKDLKANSDIEIDKKRLGIE